MTHFESKIPVDITYVRSLLLTHKNFLHAIYEAKKTPAILLILDKANYEEILLLVKILYLEANGAIELLGLHIKALK